MLAVLVCALSVALAALGVAYGVLAKQASEKKREEEEGKHALLCLAEDAPRARLAELGVVTCNARTGRWVYVDACLGVRDAPRDFVLDGPVSPSVGRCPLDLAPPSAGCSPDALRVCATRCASGRCVAPPPPPNPPFSPEAKAETRAWGSVGGAAGGLVALIIAYLAASAWIHARQVRRSAIQKRGSVD